MKWVLVCLVAACHGGGSSIYTGDAPAGFDAPPIDGPGSAVSISVTVGAGEGGGQGVTVIFTNADGSPAGMAVTGADGTAMHALGAGGFVTLVDPLDAPIGLGPIPAPHALVTYAGVKPGDHLDFYAFTVPPIPETLTVPLVGGAAAYTAQMLSATGVSSATLAPGGSAATGTIITRYGGDLLVTATDGSGALLGTLWHPDLTVTGSDDLTATDTFVPAGSATYSYANAPGELSVALDLYDSVSVGTVSASAPITPAGGSASFALPVPADPTIASQVNETYAVITSVAGGSSTLGVVDWGSAVGDYTLDLDGALLPPISAPAFDLATVALSWTEGSGAPPDLTYATLAFTGDPTVSSWQVVAPYTPGALQLPPIPGSVPSTAPTGIALQTMQVSGGYDAVRGRAFRLNPYLIDVDYATGRTRFAKFPP